MDADPLDRPLDAGDVERLHAAGLLDGPAREEILLRFLGRPDWWGWIGRGLLAAGTTLVLAGIVFFFASNWTGLGRFEKLGLVGAALAAALAGGAALGSTRPAGRALLFASTVLVGAWLAVFGQIYQTGADSCDLFFGWALLSAPLALAARSAPTGVLWFAVLEAGVAFWWEQRVGAPPAGACLILAGINLAGLLAAIWRRVRGAKLAAWGALLFVLCVPVIHRMEVEGVEAGPWALPAIAAWAIVVAAGLPYFRYRDRDLGALALAAVSICTVFLAQVGHWIFEGREQDFDFLLFALLVTATVAVAAWILNRTARAMREEPRG